MSDKRGVEIDFTKPPKFVLDIMSFFKKLKIKRYKLKKVKQEKSILDRYYYFKFRVKINDNNNPQFSQYYNIVIPHKAAFFAKMALKRHILDSVELDFDKVEEMSEEEYKNFKNNEKK